MTANTKIASIILMVYVVLLLAGGLIGFLKANSKISLITSSVFAILLILCGFGVIKLAHGADILLLILFFFFSSRLVRTQKFMPSGMMTALTFLTLVMYFVYQYS